MQKVLPSGRGLPLTISTFLFPSAGVIGCGSRPVGSVDDVFVSMAEMGGAMDAPAAARAVFFIKSLRFIVGRLGG